jgi:hypothetical protein
MLDRTFSLFYFKIGMKIKLLIIYILGGIFIFGSIYGAFVYLPSKSGTQLAMISEPISRAECPPCECPICSECKPETIVKEVPVEKIVIKEVVKEVPVEKIVEKEVIKEVPVEKIVYQDRIVYQQVSSPCDCNSTSLTEQSPVSLTLQVVSDKIFSFINPSSNSIKINFLNFVTPLESGSIGVGIKFPNSADSSWSYGLGGSNLVNYAAKVVSKYCEPNYDGILPEGCSRKGVSATINTIRPGELVEISAGLGHPTGVTIPPGKIRLNYIAGSITDTVTNADILFNNIEF